MKRLKIGLLVIAIVMASALPGPGPAQASISIPALLDESTTISGASAQIIAADQFSARRYLIIQNVCAVNIGLSSGTAVIGAAGTVTLFPGGSIEFRDAYVPQGAFNAIAASGSCGLTIWEIK